VDADAVEIRVLGCLIEKQRTTPDQYPLSMNALRLACNQSTNRDPVVDYDERTIKAALDRMSDRGWTRLASGAGSRALKYRHLLGEALELSEPELSLLAVLMLRGPQTPGELKQRTERLYRFESVGAVPEIESSVRFRALAGLGLAREEQQSWKAALSAYEAVVNRSPDATLRDWARERVAAVKARMAKPEAPAAPKSSPNSTRPSSSGNGLKPAAKKDSRP